MTPMNDDAAPRELSMEELCSVAGGRGSVLTGDFDHSVAGVAGTGGLARAAIGPDTPGSSLPGGYRITSLF